MNIKHTITTLIIALALSPLSAALARQHYGLNYCSVPGFSCITVKSGQTWQRLFPDDYQQEVVKRLNRMNTRLYTGMQIAIPDDLINTDIMDISPFPLHVDSDGEKMVVVDPNVLAWGAYDPSGNLVHWGPIAGGRSYCADVGRVCRTVTGKFAFYHKLGSGCESSKFPVGEGGAPMPYCMFFHGGFALHASPIVPGYHDSHGCVRLFLEDAKWLNEDFIELSSDTKKGTTVIVNPYL
jgi:L,D-transpeptidase ErfK/SrfK